MTHTVLQLCRLDVCAQGARISGVRRGPPPGSQLGPPGCALSQWKGREAPWVSFIRTLISVLGTLPSQPDLPEALPPNALTVGVKISTYELGGGNTNTQTAALFRRWSYKVEMIPSFMYSFKITMPAKVSLHPTIQNWVNYGSYPGRVSQFNGRGRHHYCAYNVTDVIIGTSMRCHQELREGCQERLPREEGIKMSPYGSMSFELQSVPMITF